MDRAEQCSSSNETFCLMRAEIRSKVQFKYLYLVFDNDSSHYISIR